MATSRGHAAFQVGVLGGRVDGGSRFTFIVTIVITIVVVSRSSSSRRRAQGVGRHARRGVLLREKLGERGRRSAGLWRGRGPASCRRLGLVLCGRGCFPGARSANLSESVPVWPDMQAMTAAAREKLKEARSLW